MSQFPWHVLLQVQIACSIIMLVLYLFQYAKRNANIVDVGWAFLMGTAAAWYIVSAPELTFRVIIVGLLAAFWAYRLGIFLYRYRLAPKNVEEDGRYQNMRKAMSGYEQLGFFIFFQFQSFLVPFLSIPYFVAIFNSRSNFAWYDLIGIAIWLTAIIGETIADNQLEAWKAKKSNKGKTCRKGLWKYSRHPNYFFEWIHWFAYIPFAVGSSVWYVTLLGPVVMYIFLRYFSGIPWTEMRALQSRGEDYKQYQKTTSIFFPWFPKESHS